MRRNYTFFDKNRNVITLDSADYYTYDDIDRLVETNFELLNTDDVIYSMSDARSGMYSALRNINVLFNKTIEKSPKNMISTSLIAPGTDGDILVSQGPGFPPIWKTFSSVFPSDVYYVELDESIILESDTFIEENFNDVVLTGSTWTSLPETKLETKTFIAVDYTWFSHILELTTKGALLTQIDIDNELITVDKSVKLEYNKPTRFILEDKFGNFKEGTSTPFMNINEIGGYKINRADMGYDNDFVNLYLADYLSYTSVTELDFGNYVKNDIDVISSSNKYNISVYGADNSFKRNIPVSTIIKDVSIGDGFGAIIDENDIIKVYGDNSFGEQSNTPKGSFKQVVCGKTHICAIRDDGTLVSWGSNLRGQVSETPSGYFKKVVATDYGTAAISMNNELFIWGDTFMKYSDISYQSVDVIDVSFGEKFMIIQKDDMTLDGYGDDTYGQISSINHNVKYENFSCGKYHVAGVTEHSTVMTWGSSINSQTEFPEDETILNFKKVICGDYNTIGLKLDGIIVAWGNDSSDIFSTISSLNLDDIIMNYSNVVGLSNKEVFIKERYKKRSVSGTHLSAKIIFLNEKTEVTSIKIHLEKQ